MSRTKIAILGVSYNYSENGSCTLVLTEIHGGQKIPVIVSNSDALVLAELIEANDDKEPIVNIYSTFIEALSMFNADVREILITDFSEGVFKASVILGNYIEDYAISAKLGDSLILATMNKIPIYIEDEVLNRVGIVMSNDGNISLDDDEINRRDRGPYLPVQDLEKQLEEALIAQDYEKAAEIRDQINSER